MNIFVTGQSQLLRKLLQASRSLRHYFTCHSVDSSGALCFCSILVFVSFLCNFVVLILLCSCNYAPCDAGLFDEHQHCK